MVLPEPLHQLFSESLKDYVQTCSKAEQLTLALYMSSGYQTNLKNRGSSMLRKFSWQLWP